MAINQVIIKSEVRPASSGPDLTDDRCKKCIVNRDIYLKTTIDELAKARAEITQLKAQLKQLADALISSTYTYDGHLKGKDVMFCDYCDAEPVNKLGCENLKHTEGCPIKTASEILTAIALGSKESGR